MQYIKLPIKLLELNNQFKELYTYYLIKSKIHDSSNAVCISETRLMQDIGVCHATMMKYIKELKPYFSSVTKKIPEDCIYYCNVYHFNQITRDYITALGTLRDNTELSPEQKGILLKVKMMCLKDTNFLKYSSRAELIEMLCIPKNKVHNVLKELEDKGYICFIGNSLHVSPIFFPLSIYGDETVNHIYKVIYNYCLIKRVCPPIKDNEALDILKKKFPNTDDTLLNTLTQRCASLPKSVSLDYFVKAIEDKKITKDVKTDYGFILC